MNSLSDLHRQIESAQWFAHLGEFPGQPGFVRISSLRPWADLPSAGYAIADSMNWLPSSNDEVDPIHGDSLRALAGEKDGAFARARVEAFKLALDSLARSMVQHSLLRAGPHDFSNAARGAALFAARMAASEIVVGRAGFWCSIVPLYRTGHWPCGLLESGEVVVL